MTGGAKGILNRRISNKELRTLKDTEFDRLERLNDSSSKVDFLIQENDGLISDLVVSLVTTKKE